MSKIISLLFLLLVPIQFSYSQSISSSQWVYINYPDYTVKAQVMPLKSRVNTDKEYTYSWYAFNKIMETKGSYDGKLLNGIYKSFYLNNNLKEQGNYKKGLKSGKWTCWFENGKTKEISYWKNSMKNGGSTMFDETGVELKRSNFKNDKLNGHVIEFKADTIFSDQKFKNGRVVLVKEKVIREKPEKKASSDAIKPENMKRKSENNTATDTLTKGQKPVKSKIISPKK